MTMKIVNGQAVELTAEEASALSKDAQTSAAIQAENAKTTTRGIRDGKLAACDWTQAADSPLSKEQKAAWAQYRKALRDVPSQAGFPGTVEWPVAP